MPQNNMYSDSVKQWNVVVGCLFNCVYCIKSFQRQMKRQKQNCSKCYRFYPHFHEKRLGDRLPKTQGDEFVWVGSGSDPFWWHPKWIAPILDRIWQEKDVQFFMQSKAPRCFQRLHDFYDFPPNLWLGTTLETNRDLGYLPISKAPPPPVRFAQAKNVKIDIVTIEPILDFDLDEFVKWIRILAPRVVYIGYDTKNCHLPEPLLIKARRFAAHLEPYTKVKWKLQREPWDSKTRGTKSLEDYLK